MMNKADSAQIPKEPFERELKAQEPFLYVHLQGKFIVFCALSLTFPGSRVSFVLLLLNSHARCAAGVHGVSLMSRKFCTKTRLLKIHRMLTYMFVGGVQGESQKTCCESDVFLFNSCVNSHYSLHLVLEYPSANTCVLHGIS